MEIIVLPYMAISFMIGWAIFAPFAEIDNLDRWSFARIETSDLLATFLPISFLLAAITWLLQSETVPWIFVVAIAAMIFLFTLLALIAGLFLLAKLDHPTSIKRMAIIGLIIPLGSFLTFAWIAVPLTAFAASVLYSIPAALAILPITLCLRAMSHWVCRSEKS